MKFTLGSDPELILLKNGLPISVEGMLGGTKKNPLSIGNGNFIQEDGAALEYNTKPANTKKEWLESHAQVFEYINNFCQENDLEICQECECEMPLEYHTDQYLSLGCEQDSCVYSDYESHKIRKDNSFCCVGGHIHIGMEDLDENLVKHIVYLLDCYLTIPNLDKESGNRRLLYGQAGTYRYKKGKPYFEYRTPSNWWIFTEQNRSLVYDTVKYILENMFELDPQFSIEEIKKTINENISRTPELC